MAKHHTHCSKCRGDLEPHRVGKQSYCLPCHAQAMRRHRSHQDQSPAAPSGLRIAFLEREIPLSAREIMIRNKANLIEAQRNNGDNG
jgi:hypothetical protein